MTFELGSTTSEGEIASGTHLRIGIPTRKVGKNPTTPTSGVGVSEFRGKLERSIPSSLSAAAPHRVSCDEGRQQVPHKCDPLPNQHCQVDTVYYTVVIRFYFGRQEARN
ncbi:Hypothetical protein SMAX5B_018394 [Scophthalmus maximus]|uniref:Uncharacterized protein n=1 Tax=Scophthalmus maximus TaxID=52904 RepID=A0A2U9CA24_SCOMX|nr:Hypothetical protein SMAX5B_018394 [Scophthalmus maximus]